MAIKCSFGIKADSFLDVLNETYNSISSSYRTALLEFFVAPDKDHTYYDYYVWKVGIVHLRVSIKDLIWGKHRFYRATLDTQRPFI